MPNYWGVLEDMNDEIKKARLILKDTFVSNYMDYYEKGLHNSMYLKEVTMEVNEACEMSLSQVVADFKCHFSYNSIRYEEDEIISFELISEKMGNVGTLEIPGEDDPLAMLMIKKESFVKLLKEVTVHELAEYTDHLKEIEKALYSHNIHMKII